MSILSRDANYNIDKAKKELNDAQLLLDVKDRKSDV